MRKLIIAAIFTLILFSQIIPSSISDTTTYTIVPPPTPAVKSIQTENGTLDTKVYNEKINIVGQGAVHVTSSEALKTIFINSGGITPAGDRFGWFATDSSPNLQNMHFYNFSTGPGITATVGPDDFILSAINFVNATSKICGAGSAVTAFDNNTGTFTCSPFLQSINGNSSANQFIIGTSNHISVSNLGNTNKIDILFKINNATCSAGSFFKSYDNKTGNLICASPGSMITLDTMQNIGTGQASVYAGNTTNTNFTFKTFKQGTGISLANNTNDITISTNFKVNSKTCTSQFFSAFDNATGVFTCGSVSGFLTSINGDTTAAQIIAGTANHISVSTAAGTTTINTLFKINNATCGSGRFSSYDNKTGNFVCTGGTGGIITSQNIGKATGSKGVLASPTSTAVRGKNMSSTTNLISFSTSNATDIIASSSFKANSITCVSQFINAFNNVTGLYSCGSVSGFLTSLNGQTGPALNLVRGSSNSTTITNSSNTITVTLKSNVVLLNGSDQGPFTKNLDFGSSTTQKHPNTGIIIRNPTSTFATTIKGGAQTSNQTLQTPIISQTDTLAALAVKNNFTKIQNTTAGYQINGLSISRTVEKTTNYSITKLDDTVIMNATSSSITATLPTSNSTMAGKLVLIKMEGLSAGNVVTVKPASGQTINGFSDGYNMTHSGEIFIGQANGTAWNKLNNEFGDAPTTIRGSTTRWLIAATGTIAGTTLDAASTIYAMPLKLDYQTQFDKMSIEVSTAANPVSTKCRLGIYQDSGNYYPTKLITGSDMGESTTSAAIHAYNFTSPITLKPGYYWEAVSCGTAATTQPTFRAVQFGLPNVLGFPGSIGGGGTNSEGAMYRATGITYGAMPTTFPSGAGIVSYNTLSAPLIALEVKKG